MTHASRDTTTGAIFEAKTKDGNSIMRKVKMNLSKISKF